VIFAWTEPPFACDTPTSPGLSAPRGGEEKGDGALIQHLYEVSTVKLVVGLGNPGPKYERTRHNIGFMAIDAIARRWNLRGPREKFNGEIAEGEIGGERVVALKPMTFMNNSGESVAPAARFYKIEPAEIIVIHDELDLVEGKVRIKRGGGAAGHNGLRSIDAHLGQDYWRMRLGIGHPGRKDLVLHYSTSCCRPRPRRCRCCSRARTAPS
jgi:PTH1 family peptidyl-tRNA hydrolase